MIKLAFSVAYNSPPNFCVLSYFIVNTKNCLPVSLATYIYNQIRLLLCLRINTHDDKLCAHTSEACRGDALSFSPSKIGIQRQITFAFLFLIFLRNRFHFIWHKYCCKPYIINYSSRFLWLWNVYILTKIKLEHSLINGKS